MTYTTHGHHIPGTVRDGDTTSDVIRCGSVKICQKCKAEAIEALPADSIVSADLRNDLEALGEFVDIAKGHPSGLPVVWKRRQIRNEEFMEFVDTPEGREDIMNWLHLNRIEAAFWPGNPDTTTKPRVEFLLEGYSRKLEIFPGQYLRKTFFDWHGNRRQEPTFEVLRAQEVEAHYEPSSMIAPAPWLFNDNAKD